VLEYEKEDQVRFRIRCWSMETNLRLRIRGWITRRRRRRRVRYGRVKV